MIHRADSDDDLSHPYSVSDKSTHSIPCTEILHVVVMNIKLAPVAKDDQLRADENHKDDATVEDDFLPTTVEDVDITAEQLEFWRGITHQETHTLTHG